MQYRQDQATPTWGLFTVRTQDGSVLYVYPKLEADSSIHSKVIRGYQNLEIGSPDPGHVHLWVVLWFTRSRFPSSMSVPNLLRPDHKTTPKWAWRTSRDQISKFWDHPYNFGTNRDIRFKFGINIQDGPLLRPDHKATPKWAWSRSRDRILHSKDELLPSQLMLHQR